MILDVVLGILALAFVIATALPLIRHDQWWIRVFDFPRAQITIGGLIVLAVHLYVWQVSSTAQLVLMGALVVSVVYQVIQMFPYTPVAPRQVHRAGRQSSEGEFSLLIANVLMTNREDGRFLELIESNQPDIVLAVETDRWWEERLRVLEADYPYTVKCPLENTYGMLLYSRLKLDGPEVCFLLEEDIPSMRARVELESGRHIQLRCVHPKPPYPKEAEHTTKRDAELLIVGREVKGLEEPVVVCGDLNDVAWSHTTHLFQKISGLLDPRRGRGMYNTFDARIPILRWPLDHVFHSEDFKLVELKRLPAFGSDHFPVFVKLSLEVGAAAEQEEPHADGEEQEEAAEKIEKAVQS